MSYLAWPTSVAWGCLLVFATSVGLAADPPEYKIQSTKGRDVLAVAPDKDATFQVTRKFGIDGAVISLEKGTWPERIVLRFDQFPALEGFELKLGHVSIKAGFGFNDRAATKQFDAQGQPASGSDQAVYTLTFRSLGKTGIEVYFPASMLPARTKTLSLNWVDAYRG